MKFLAIVVMIGWLLIGCGSGDSHVELAKGFVLLRNNSSDVRLVDWEGTNSIAGVVSIATGSNVIVAVTLEHTQSNYWIVNVGSRAIDGPYASTDYENTSKSDSRLTNLTFEGVWSIRSSK